MFLKSFKHFDNGFAWFSIISDCHFMRLIRISADWAVYFKLIFFYYSFYNCTIFFCNSMIFYLFGKEFMCFVIFCNH